MLHLSRLIGQPVRDSSADTIGVIDDLIVYYMNDQWYRMVVNAGTRDKDLDWLRHDWLQRA